MGKLIKAGAYFFAVIGFAITAGAAYVYVTNSELAGEFWSVRDEFRALPAERRQAVAAELPDRVRFEREISEDMAALSEERRIELYETLESDRRRVLTRMRKQIAAEAAVARQLDEAKSKGEEITESIKQSVSEVVPDIAPVKPRHDPLSEVVNAEDAVDEALLRFGSARQSADSEDRITAAVGVLEALDSLGDAIIAARQGGLSDREQAQLGDIVTRAKGALVTAKNTPRLDSHPDARRLLGSIPAKLNAE